MFKSLILRLVLVIAMTAGFAAAATIVQFEGFGGNTIVGSQDVDGYNFASSAGHFHLGDGLGGVPVNGTGILLQDRPATITLTLIGGGAFNLLSGDFGEDNSFGNSATSIRVEGFLLGGGSIIQDVILDGNGASFQNVALPGFTKLTSVTFTGLGTLIDPDGLGFTLDNLSAEDGVPEPTSVTLVCGALAAIAFRRMRRT